MKDICRTRPLCFERMEERLALSASTGLDFSYMIDTMTADQGGYIVVGQYGREFHSNAFDVNGNLITVVALLDANKNLVFYSSVTDSVTFSEAFNAVSGASGDRVFPISQPRWGNGEIASGIVSLAEIFRPTTPVASAVQAPVREQPAVEMVQTVPTEMNTPSLTLAKARDVFFEVAGRAEREAMSRESLEGLSGEQLVPPKVERPIVTQEADPAPAKAKPLNSSAEVRPVPQAYLVDFEPTAMDSAARADSQRNDSAANKVGDNTSRQQDVSNLDDKLSGVTARDRVLADWRRSESSRDEAVSHRTRESEEHLAAWPVLGALVGGGWLIKSRRRPRPSLSRRSPG